MAFGAQGGIPTVSFFGSRFPKCLKFQTWGIDGREM